MEKENDYLVDFITADKAPVKVPFIGKIWNDDYLQNELHSFPGQKINVVLLAPGLANNELDIMDLMKTLCASKFDRWQLGDNPQGVIYCCGMKIKQGDRVELWGALHRIPEGILR